MGRNLLEPGHESVWDYAPPPRFEDYNAFYPSRMEARWVAGEKVQAREGGFYGGWITPDVVGPFKGSPATWGW